MKRPHRLLPYVAFAVLGLAFTHLYLEGQVPSLRENPLSILNDVSRLDAQWDRDMLRVRQGILRHYNSLDETALSIQQLLNRLAEDSTTAYNSTATFISEGIETLHGTVTEKIDRVERIKSQTALMANSLSFLGNHQQELLRRTDGSAPAGELARLSAGLLVFVRAPSEDAARIVNDSIARLLEQPAPVRDSLLSSVSHARVVLKTIPVLDQLLRSIPALGVPDQIDSLRQEYLRIHAEQSTRAALYRSALFAVSALLLGYWLVVLLRLQRSSRDLALSVVGLKHEIVARERVEQALKAEKEHALVTLHSIADGVITTDSLGKVVSLNHRAEIITGWKDADARGQAILDVLPLRHEGSHAAQGDPVRHCLAAGHSIEVETDTLLVDSGGREHYLHYSVAPIPDNHESFMGAVVVFRDISASRQLIQQMAHQAAHDALTGLVNRHKFEHHLQTALTHARRHRSEHALLYLDLDQFKLVNDACGHAAGDELLRRLTKELHAVIRTSDILGRLGGDEFGVLLENCPLPRAAKVAEDLRRKTADFQFAWQGRGFVVGVSIGVVPITYDSENIAQIMSCADLACYAAKDLGRNRIHIYQPQDETLTLRQSELQWAPEIKLALEQNRFLLHYQRVEPIEQSPGQTRQTHCELLIRMRDRDGKLVMPGSFIPAAERYNLIGELDRWVIREACRHCQEHMSLPGGAHHLALNLSGNSLTDSTLATYIRKCLNEYRVPPSSLCFEITETAAIANHDIALVFIREVREMGCSFALDDFGVGLSSLAYLKSFPVDYLKIDGRFVRDIADDPVSYTMVSAIHQLGQVMGIQTIAECVENETILDRLRQIGVNYAQGYLLHRPEALAPPSGSGSTMGRAAPLIRPQ